MDFMLCKWFIHLLRFSIYFFYLREENLIFYVCSARSKKLCWLPKNVNYTNVHSVKSIIKINLTEESILLKSLYIIQLCNYRKKYLSNI